MDIFIFKDCNPDNIEALTLALEYAFSGKKKTNAMTGAERSKRHREKQKALLAEVSETKNVTNETENVTENVTIETEKKEEEKESVSPLSSPLPFPPNTPNPITPIIPSSQEKEEGKKDSHNSGVPKRIRTGLVPYGPNQDVYLTENEYSNLCDKYGKELVDKKIIHLSYYMGQNEKNRSKYTNHNMTLHKWLIDELDGSPKKKEPEETGGYTDYFDDITWEGKDE